MLRIISLSFYALTHELYIYDKLFHKLTINKKKKTKKDQKIMKTLWIMFAFIVDSNNVFLFELVLLFIVFEMPFCSCS